MATKSAKQQIDAALGEVEKLADEIELKLHLASMDAKDAWATRLEPKLRDVQARARHARETSARALHEVADALKEFSRSL